MYTILEEQSDHAIGLKVDGKLTKKDYDSLVPYLETLINQRGPMSLLCDMTNWEGMEIKACVEDMKFSMRHLRDFKRVAVVGDQRWLDWCMKLFDPLVKTEMKAFSSEKIEEAWNWVRA